MDSCLRYLVVLAVASFFVYEAQASALELVREKRDTGGVNVMQLFLQVEQVVDKCKKPNPPPASNQTNKLIVFLEAHDMQCLIDGMIKIYQQMTPPQNQSRKKRDTGNIIAAILGFETEIQKCKKDPPTPSNSTNPILYVMNHYDIECLAKAVISAVKSMMPKNPTQRTKRALEIADYLCIGTKIINDESKIQEIVKAYKPSRKARAASGTDICNDIGTAIDSVLKIVMDFAPNQP